MEWQLVAIFVLVIGLLVTFLWDFETGKAGGNKDGKASSGEAAIVETTAPADRGISREGNWSSLLGVLGLKPRLKARWSSPQQSVGPVEGLGQEEQGLIRDVATALKEKRVHIVSPLGDFQIYDEMRASELESRVRAAYSDLDFRWTFACRFRCVGQAEDAGRTESLDGFVGDDVPLRRLPEWERMTPEKAVIVSYNAPKSISGLVLGEGKSTRVEKTGQLKIAPLPYQRRGDQAVFFATESDAGVKGLPPVVQAFKPLPCDIGTCESYAERYAVTSFLLTIFSQRVRAEGLDTENLTVPNIKVATILDRSPPLQGVLEAVELDNGEAIDFDKDTFGEKDRKMVAFIQTFMHWTYHRTHGELMVIVRKGVKVAGVGCWIVEPEIHTKNSRCFGSNDNGKEAMSSFFSEHRCNHYCDRIIAGKTKRVHRHNKGDVSGRSIKGLGRLSKGDLSLKSIKALTRTSTGGELSRMSIKDSAKAWSPRSAQQLKNTDHNFAKLLSPRPPKAARCDLAPLWKVLTRNKKV